MHWHCNIPSAYVSLAVQVDKTTNVCEGFHNKLNTALGRRHPTVFKVIEVFKDIEESHEREIAQLSMGTAPNKCRRKYVEVDAALIRLRIATFGGGAIPNTRRILDYMDAAAYQLWDARH
jgi:hypothetical protein